MVFNQRPPIGHGCRAYIIHAHHRMGVAHREHGDIHTVFGGQFQLPQQICFAINSLGL